MTQTITPKTEWRELVGQANKLIAEIREAATAPKDGAVFNGAEDQIENRHKFAEAQRLLGEAKRLKEEAAAKGNASLTQEALDEIAREAAAFGAPAGSTGSLDDLVNGQSGGHAKDKHIFNPFNQGKTQIVKASGAALSHQLMEDVMPPAAREAAKEVAREAARDSGAVTQKEIAALVEGTQANGGFLVVPQYMQDLFAAVRRQGNALRRLGWLNIHRTEETNQVLFPKASGSLVVGLVAELAVKPTADNNYSQVTVSLYTMAGIASISRQLAKSADPSVAQILARDLAMLLGNLEEQLVYTGTGAQQPRGILNTVGTSTAPSSNIATLGTPAAGGGQTLVDAMFDLAAAIASNYYAPATGAVMRPSRLAFLQKAKDTNNNYILNKTGTYRAPDASEAEDIGGADTYDIIGFPMAQSTNVPNTLGGGTNQDAIILAAWEEAHWFQRWDQQLDSSDIASDGAGNSAFATNRVLFRLEQIAGFTAERYPSAFGALTGAGMLGAF